jgi:hypothetical protein
VKRAQARRAFTLASTNSLRVHCRSERATWGPVLCASCSRTRVLLHMARGEGYTPSEFGVHHRVQRLLSMLFIDMMALLTPRLRFLNVLNP